jgi:hypothetical protein
MNKNELFIGILISVLAASCVRSQDGTFTVDDNNSLYGGNYLECSQLSVNFFECTQKRRSDGARIAKGIYSITSPSRWATLRELVVSRGGDPIELATIRVSYRWRGKVLYAACANKTDPNTGAEIATLAIARSAQEFLAERRSNLEDIYSVETDPVFFSSGDCAIPVAVGPAQGAYPRFEARAGGGGIISTQNGVYWTYRRS